MAIGSGTLIQGVCEFCSPCQKTEITRQAHEADRLLSSLPKHCQEKGAKRQIIKEMSYLHKMPVKSILSLIGRPGGVPLHERLTTKVNSVLSCQVFSQAEMVGPQVYISTTTKL